MVHRLCHRSGVPAKSAENEGNRSKIPRRLRERLFLLTRSRCGASGASPAAVAANDNKGSGSAPLWVVL